MPRALVQRGRGRDRHADRRERRRQDDHAPRRGGRHAPAQRTHRLPRPGRHAHAGTRARARRRRARPRGPQRIPGAHRAREPRDGRLQAAARAEAARRAARAHAEDVPAPARARRSSRRHALGRRAADARARARPHVRAAAPVHGRAFARPRAARGAGHLQEHSRGERHRDEHPARRAERALRPRDREPRLCAADRAHHRRGELCGAEGGSAGEGSLFGETIVMADKFSLQGKCAIVTGAAGGIGGAIVRAFRDAGAKVAGVDLDAAKMRADLAIDCDVSSESETRQAVERAVQAFGALHVLVNAAATRDPTASVTELDLAAWNRVFAVNVGGTYLMSRWAIPHIARAGGGSIIHIASQLGTVGTAGRVAYCSTKGALITMAKAMAVDHAAQKIRVNTLSPGAVETERMPLRFGTMEKARAVMGPKHLLNRLGQPDEIAQAALFLASDASSFMTGSDLRVDGGYNAV